ncbi:hypothetical protein E4U60_007402 [Claviceps pazoutovae]|uniref:Ima1 N-terminal domain-containing protein n=1 Tax=Claviceps pazoutovae TaxID=1649127 RepID=A0A9P7SHM4_9HYPO|nr:hypothetical protein E4U60_007402 [Claviceps pazoutovae]
MPRFRGAKYLTCFYCGKRSGVKFDGAIRDFLCSHCDATNFLDQNGQITDPPVATDREATAVQYAAPQSNASPSQDDPFCQTCLKNQHLFTKSLAQYLPDDPSDPDYPELERNYYRYRRNLEKRYPQVCSDCAEKVRARVRQAGYTAKTDHLRRMMNLSRGRKTKKRTMLDWIHTLGKTLWRSGFVLQIGWHFVMITRALEAGNGVMYDPDDQGTVAKVLPSLKRATENMPAAGTLIQWSIWTGLMAAWWNPHFVQLNRGFTKHLLGFTQWYSLQGLIVFFRLIFRGMDVRGAHAPRSGHARLGAHIGMAFIMIVLYILALRSIRVDTTPLFATYDTQPSGSRHTMTPKQRKEEDSKTFSELFHDALDSTNATSQMTGGANAQLPPSPHDAMRTGANVELAAPTPNQRRYQQAQYEEEMDWSPIPPRNLASEGTAAITPTSTRFSHRFDAQTPSRPQLDIRQEYQAGFQGPGTTEFSNAATARSLFRSQAPLAPVQPSRQLCNTPWPSVEAKQEPLATGMATRKRHQRYSSGSSTNSDGEGNVDFKPPSFFAQDRDREASSLADLLNQSFSLGQDDQGSTTEEQDSSTEERGFQRLSQRPARREPSAKRAHRPRPTATHSASLEPVILAILLAVWLLASYVPLPYGWEIQIGALSMAGLIALRNTGDTGRATSGTTPTLLLYVLSALAVAELAAICWVGSALWSSRLEQLGWHGAGVLTSLFCHQVLNRFIYTQA